MRHTVGQRKTNSEKAMLVRSTILFVHVWSQMEISYRTEAEAIINFVRECLGELCSSLL